MDFNYYMSSITENKDYPIINKDTVFSKEITDNLYNVLSVIGMYNLTRYHNLYKSEDLFSILLNEEILELCNNQVMNDKYTLQQIVSFFDSFGVNPISIEKTNNRALNSSKKKTNFNLVNTSNFWTKKYQELLDSSNSNTLSPEQINSILYDSCSPYLNILRWKEESVSWSNIYSNIKNIIKSASYATFGIEVLIQNLAKYDPIFFKMEVDENIFGSHSFSYPLRSIFYIHYIKNGFLSKKTARKLRSEPSESCSLDGVRALLRESEKNSSLYPNLSELLIQFSDTKYPTVEIEVANHSPISILPSLVGFKHPSAKKIIEGRMNNGK